MPSLYDVKEWMLHNPVRGILLPAAAGLYGLLQVVTAVPAALDGGHDYIRAGDETWGESGKTQYSSSVLNVGDLQRSSWWNPFAAKRITTHKFQTAKSDQYITGFPSELTAVFAGDPEDLSTLELLSLTDSKGKNLLRNASQGNHAIAEQNHQDLLGAVLEYVGTDNVQDGLRAVPPGPAAPQVPAYR